MDNVQYTDKLLFAVDKICLPEAAQVDGADWEKFQLQFFNNSTRFGIDTKARQIAWSWTAACDAVIDSILNPGTPHIFVSINLDEAKEKIRYARQIVSAIVDPKYRPRLARDSQTELEFTNGSRLLSHPCRPPRGKARSRIYLDEMAHYKSGTDREIYTAALPSTTKGDGYVRIGSSPLGATGLFWEIVTESMRRYPGYDGNRRIIPWWGIRALCKDVETAQQIAPEMLTEERVQAFGTPVLIEIYENMFLEDFQQEYECAWIDEAIAWISWQNIKNNQDSDLLWWHAKSVDEAIATVPQIQEAIRCRKIESVFVGGLDVGRVKDLTEFVVVGRGAERRLPVRFMVSLDRVEFDDQQDCFRHIITSLPFSAVLVDKTGLGMQLAENLEQTGRAIGVSFTNEIKELFAVEARIQAERGKTPLPLDRDLAYQIHSIKKTVTAAKYNRYDTERNEKHHADKFWGWAMAIYAAAAIDQARISQPEIIYAPQRIGPDW
jgi:phage FluMu gp28-like protein